MRLTSNLNHGWSLLHVILAGSLSILFRLRKEIHLGRCWTGPRVLRLHQSKFTPLDSWSKAINRVRSKGVNVDDILGPEHLSGSNRVQDLDFLRTETFGINLGFGLHFTL